MLEAGMEKREGSFAKTIWMGLQQQTSKSPRVGEEDAELPDKLSKMSSFPQNNYEPVKKHQSMTHTLEEQSASQKLPIGEAIC
jgi:hypothetical protein